MLKIAQKDGTFLKMHRRKKKTSTGRKRGRPRKTKEITSIATSKKRPYSIILTSHGKQKKTLKTFKTEQEAYTYFKTILDENKSIKFPVKYINYKKIKEAKYEIYIIKKLDEYEIKDTMYLRNEMGNFVEYDTNLEQWQIIDKSNWDMEETFWVYGYDPIHQRKDFQWIIDNKILSFDYYSFKNILIYKNKLIIDTNGDIDIIFCKNISDAYRLYTEIENFCNKKKIKKMMFSGSIQDFSYSTLKTWIDKLCEVTGFSRHKILRNSLRT